MNHPRHLPPPPPSPNNRFFTPNPSFNPNPNFHPSFLPAPPPPLPPSQLNPVQPPPNDAPLPDLPSSLSLLTNLLDLTTSTLNSLSSLLSHHPLPISPHGLSRCPSNLNHLMPPESLFLHSLLCPSPVAEDVRSLLDALHYTKTLKSQPQIDQNHFAAPLSDPHSELCFSLDDYVDFGSNFFYQDCPGVVTSLPDDGGKRMFSLPGVLSVECANFASGMDELTSDSFGLLLLPSELWVVSCEVGQWSDFPNAYSYAVLRAVLCVELAKEHDLLTCVIANSPRFGVIIDPPMRDHIFVLFRLCVKAIVKETHHSYQPLSKATSENSGGHLNPKTMSFRCPALVNALSWLATQLSVLYGEANAKQFTIGMLKQLLQNVASSSLVYPLDKNLEQVLDNEPNLMSPTGNNVRADESSGPVGHSNGGGIVSGAIFVYQVAVAIAALHERSFLEDKIKALRSYRYMNAYQRVAEHDYLSKKAQDERGNRPNYRPLVDHDGLPVQCQHDKDMADRNKTKEQLLAEERDYKRRRMSYRGKKTKRNVKEVMRNIIEEHMEAIREAGGIGCFDQGVKDGLVSTSEPTAQNYGKNVQFNRSMSYEYEPSRNHSNVYNKHLNDFKTQTMDPSEHARDQKVSSRSRDSRDRDSSYHSRDSRERNQEGSRYQRNGRRKEIGRHDSYPRSPSRERNYRSYGDEKSDWKKETEDDDSYSRKYGQSRKQRSDRRLEREDSDSYHRSPSIEKHDRSTDQRSSRRNESDREFYKSRSTSTSGRKDKRRFEDQDRERRKRVRNDRSGSIAGSEFDDRYAPSRSPEM